MDLIPPALIVARYFATERAQLDELEARRGVAKQELEEFTEQNSGEEGLLENSKTEKGALTKASVSERLKEVKKDPDSGGEKQALTRCLQLIGAEATIS